MYPICEVKTKVTEVVSIKKSAQWFLYSKRYEQSDDHAPTAR